MSKTQPLKFVRHPHAAPTSADRRADMLGNPGFGRVFSDHMVTIRYSDDQGWHDARIEPRGPIQMDPAAAVLHYAQEIFEGLKAYRTGDGGATLFRPRENARRFQQSAERLAMPVLPEELFLEAVDQLVSVDRDWIPEGDGSLYIRPFMFATEIFLGVKPSSTYLFIVIASSVGSYFKSGADAVSLWSDGGRHPRARTSGSTSGPSLRGQRDPVVDAIASTTVMFSFPPFSSARWTSASHAAWGFTCC